MNLKFQPELCNVCHELVLKVINFNDVFVITVKRNVFRIHFLLYE